MSLKNLWQRLRDSRAAQVASQAHTHADHYYQAATQANRPLEAETHKQPLVAALLSLLLAGAGQLYNRQLARALVLFFFMYVIGGVVLLVYGILWLTLSTREHLVALGYSLLAIWGSLWLFSIVDAWRTAAALRRGRLLVRYGFRRQGLYAALGFLPLADFFVPSETVPPEEVGKSVGEVVKDAARDKLLKWVLKRVGRYGGLGLGTLLLLVGVFAAVPALQVVGTLLVQAGVILFFV